jgi:hypothetical protein
MREKGKSPTKPKEIIESLDIAQILSTSIENPPKIENYSMKRTVPYERI